MSTPEQPPLFELPPEQTPRTSEELAALGAEIAANSKPVQETETATDRYYAELGGGTGSGTATQEPPRMRQPDKRPMSRRAGMSREEARAQDHEEIARANRLTGFTPKTPEEIAEQNRIRSGASYQAAKLAVAAVESGSIARKAAGNATLEQALKRAQEEKRD